VREFAPHRPVHTTTTPHPLGKGLANNGEIKSTETSIITSIKKWEYARVF